MKKIVIAVVMLLFMVGNAFAAWTVALNKTGYPRAVDWGGGSKLIIFKIDCTSDANASGTQTLSTLINTAFGANSGAAQQWKNLLYGAMFYTFKYALTGTVDSAPTFSVTDEVGQSLNASTAAATSGGASYPGNIVTNQYTPVTDLIFTSTTLGNTKAMSLYFCVLK